MSNPVRNVSGSQGCRNESHTFAEDSTEVEAKERGFRVDEVMLQDVLDCTNVAQPEAVVLKLFIHQKVGIVESGTNIH
jgi:hypothetical protein